MSAFQLAVVNAGGNDSNQEFAAGLGQPGQKWHPPVNYHALAACTGGAFLREVSQCGTRPVLLLIGRNPSRALAAMRRLKRAGNPTMLAFKEAGMHQVAETLREVKPWEMFQELVSLADGAIATTPELVPFFTQAGAARTTYIPTPYPFDIPGWNFENPSRHGVFIGTREWDVPSRRHLAALVTARGLATETSVTVMNLDGRKGRKRLESIGLPRLRTVEKRMDYCDYLRLMAQHRLVWQLDRSRVPGQVAGDALLCGIPCVGGDGAVDREVYPDLSGDRVGDDELLERAKQLITDDGYFVRTIEQARELASERLSFASARRQLEAWYGST